MEVCPWVYFECIPFPHSGTIDGRDAIEEWGLVLCDWTEHYPHTSKTFRTVASVWMKKPLEKQ